MSNPVHIFKRPHRPNWYVWVYEMKGERRIQRVRSTDIPVDTYSREQAQDIINKRSRVRLKTPGTIGWLSDKLTARIKGEVKSNLIRESSAWEFGVAFNYLQSMLGKEYPVSDITKGVVNQFKIYMLGLGKAETTVNKTISYLRAGFNRMVDDEVIQSNPFDRCERIRVKQKDLSLSREEFVRTLQYSLTLHKPYHHRMIYVLLYTAARIGEVLTIKRSDINLENNTITIYNNKVRTHERRVIGIQPKLKRHLLWFLGENTADNPLGLYNRNIISRYIKRCMRGSGVNDKKAHSLRHSFASWAIKAGVNPRYVQEHLGHTSLSTTERFYIHGVKGDGRVINI